MCQAMLAVCGSSSCACTLGCLRLTITLRSYLSPRYSSIFRQRGRHIACSSGSTDHSSP